MRQMKAKSSQYQRAPGHNRRGKSAVRPSELRSARKVKSAEKPEPGMIRRIFFGRPIFTLTLGLVLACGLVGLFAGGHVAKVIAQAEAALAAPFTDAGFALREVTVTGAERTTPESASAALALPKGGSIFNVKPDAARARLLMLPWVADAEVQRQFPDKVTVRLMEKRPFALWKTGNELSVVERSGAVIIKVQDNVFGHLPVISGAGAPDAAAPIIDALAKEKAIQARLVSLERVGDRRWDLHLAGGVTVRLPEDGWERQLSELERLIIEKGVLERDIEMIDLRYPDNYVFRLHNGDSRPVPRERHA
jgi:cell division protein FtsQ